MVDLPDPKREFEIAGEQGKQLAAKNPHIKAVIMPSQEGQSKMFRRNALKQVLSPAAHKVQWLVMELKGVRVYVHDHPTDGVSLVMTETDMYP